jgi:hypothetical protein
MAAPKPEVSKAVELRAKYGALLDHNFMRDKIEVDVLDMAWLLDMADWYEQEKQ